MIIESQDMVVDGSQNRIHPILSVQKASYEWYHQPVAKKQNSCIVVACLWMISFFLIDVRMDEILDITPTNKITSE